MSKNPSVVYINGRFLGQRLSGVQRFAREIIVALDAEIEKLEGRGLFFRWILVAPKVIVADLQLRNIEVRRAGWGNGHFWDQLIFPFVARAGIAVGLANNGAVLHGRSLTVLHDAMVFRTPRNFSTVYALFHRTLDRLLAIRSRIATVSEFSRCELADVLGVDSRDIFVIPNGCDHLDRVTVDKSVLNRLGLAPKQYFLFVGSLSPNKNLMRTIEAFASITHSGRRLLVVGAPEASFFRAGSYPIAPGVIFAGYLSDGEIAALYSDAVALIFPSLYEGFGIPPLEAMTHGCPVLAADIPSVREVCGSSAIYFDPLDIDSIARALSCAANGVAPFPPAKRDAMIRCSHYTWSNSARSLVAAISSFVRERTC